MDAWERACADLARRPGWCEWGVQTMVVKYGMCPACLEVDLLHSYWCSLLRDCAALEKQAQVFRRCYPR